MTLRDLTPKQLYNLRRRCEKERKQYNKSLGMGTGEGVSRWEAAYSKGLKAGLAQQPPTLVSSTSLDIT